MKKGLLYRAIVIVLICAMVFSLAGFQTVDLQDATDGVQVEDQEPSTDKPTDNPGGGGEGGQGETGEQPEQPEESEQPDKPNPEDDMIKVTVVSDIKGGTVSCENLPEDGMVKKGTELTFKAVAATEGVMASKLVGATVNGKAVEVDEDGSFKVIAEPDGNKNEIVVSAEFFGIESVTVDSEGKWTQSKTVTVKAFGDAKVTLANPEGKEITGEKGKFIVNDNIGKDPVDYTVTVTAKDAKGTSLTIEIKQPISYIDNSEITFEVNYSQGLNRTMYEVKVINKDNGADIVELRFKCMDKNGDWVDPQTSSTVNLKKKYIQHSCLNGRTYKVIAKDAAGNEAEIVLADISAPDIFYINTDKGYKDTEGVIWVREGASLIVKATDPSGVKNLIINNNKTIKVEKTNEKNDDGNVIYSAKFLADHSEKYTIKALDAADADDKECNITPDEYAETVEVRYDPNAPVIDEKTTYAASTELDANWLKKLLNEVSGGRLFNEAFDINFVVSDGVDNKEDDTYASGIASVEYALFEGKGKTSVSDEELQNATWENDGVNLEKSKATVKIKKDFEGCIALKVTDKAGNVSYAVVGFKDDNTLSGELVTNKVTFNDSTRGDGFDPKLTVMVTTPAKDANAENTKYTDYNEKVNDENNWVKSVKFEVNAQRPALPENKTTETSETTYEYVGAPTFTVTYGEKTVTIGNAEVTDKGNGGYTFTFSLGDADISFSGEVKFTLDQKYKEVTQNYTVNAETQERTPDGAPVETQIDFDTVSTSATVHVQNYLNPATVGYVVNDAENETQATAGNEYGWFNGFDNVLWGLNIKGSAGSEAPAWTYYTLTYQNVLQYAGEQPGQTTILSVTEYPQNSKDPSPLNNSEGDDNKLNKVDIITTLTKSGYYTLTVWSKDAAGNETTKATYVFKYDNYAPVITANFSQTPVYKNGFYKMQRMIEVKIADDAFTGNETANDLFALTLKPENGENPVVLDNWAYTPYKENQPGGYWLIKYTCGEKEDSGIIGDLYKLDVVSLDNAGNTSITDKDGNLYKNGGDPLGNSYNGDDFVDFNIDQQKPVVSVVFDNNNALNGKYFAAGRTATITVNEHNFDPARVDMKATGATSGADGAKGWKQSESNKDVWTKTVVFNPTDANCEFSISVIDKAGNVCDENEVNYNGSVAHDKFVVDRVNPTLNITGTNATPYAGNCTPGFSGRDTNMSNKYTMTLTRTVRASRNENVSDRFLNKGSVTVTGTSINAVFNTLTKGAENDGIYKLDVTITDMAGNSTQASSTFTVNRHGSFYVFNEALADVVNAKFVQKADGKYSVTEYNASPLVSGSVKIEIYCDGQLVNTIKPQTAAGGIGSSGLYEYTYDLPAENFKNDGRYKIAITSEDAARNQSDSTKLDESVIEFVVDSVKPEIVLIKGLEEKIVNADKLNVSANAIDTYGIGNIKVVVDGKVVKEYVTQEEYDKLHNSGNKLDHEYAVLTDMLDFTAEYTLLESSSSRSVEFVVTDMAGNSFTTSADDFAPSFDFNNSVLVSTSFWARYIHNVWAIIATVAVIVGAAAAWYFLFGKKNKKEAKSAA